MHSSLLILLLVVPLVGAVIGAFLSDYAARGWALLVSLVTLAISLWVAAIVFAGPVPANGQMLLVHPPSLPAQIPLLGTSISLGINQLSIWLVLLTTFLQPLAILSSYGSIKTREREYYAWMNALLVPMIGVFIARDLLLFYVFFELTLIPMYFLIGIWGGPDRRYASTKFFLFTFTGGVLTLAAAVYLGLSAGTFSLDDWGNHHGVVSYAQLFIPETARWWVVLGLLAGFAVKTPLFPVHTWLPLAHTEAPTAGSVILAGVLLKLGTYGLLILAVPIGIIGPAGPVFPGLVHFVGIICVIGIIYGALCAWVQPDIKKLVAFSSVSHLGFCILGMFALTEIGVQGSVLYMINHGLSTGAMFLVIGMIYDRYHTRSIDKLSGLAANMPILAFFFIFFTLSSIGLPFLNGFVSEFLTTLGAFTSPYLNVWYGSFAAIGVILGAVYMLHMAARVIMGPLKVPDVDHGDGHGAHAATDHGHDHAPAKNDIGLREISILVPLAIVVVIIGVRPGIILNTMRGEVERILTPFGQPTLASSPAPQQLEPQTVEPVPAQLVFVEADPEAPAAWNLTSAPANSYWSLQIAVYRDGPNRKQYAVDAVKALRDANVDAYFYHGQSASAVCVGSWPMDAVKPTSSGDTRMFFDPKQSSLRRSITQIGPSLIVLDQSMTRTMSEFPDYSINGTVVETTGGNGKKIKAHSILVEIPHRASTTAPAVAVSTDSTSVRVGL